MVVVGVDYTSSVDAEHPGASDGVEVVDADTSRSGIDVDELRLAVEGAQAVLVVVLRSQACELCASTLCNQKPELTENQLQRPAPNTMMLCEFLMFNAQADPL